MSLTAERLRALLSFDVDNGAFTRKIAFPGYRAGTIAGSVDHYGYITIMVDGKHYKAHRLAWLYEHGEWPIPEVDHIDGDKLNNRISNLRVSSSRMNAENKRAAKRTNKLGVLGVSLKHGKFLAQIQVKGVKVHLGYFRTQELAQIAYLQAKRENHEGCTI